MAYIFIILNSLQVHMHVNTQAHTHTHTYVVKALKHKKYSDNNIKHFKTKRKDLYFLVAESVKKLIQNLGKKKKKALSPNPFS